MDNNKQQRKEKIDTGMGPVMSEIFWTTLVRCWVKGWIKNQMPEAGCGMISQLKVIFVFKPKLCIFLF